MKPIYSGEVLSSRIAIVNPGDRDWTKHRFILWFGTYGWTKLMVWANSLDNALDEAVDWLAEHAPGILCDDVVKENYNEALAEGKSEKEAQEIAEQDTTTAGNAGHYICSWQWGITIENPTRNEILAIMKGK